MVSARYHTAPLRMYRELAMAIKVSIYKHRVCVPAILVAENKGCPEISLQNYAFHVGFKEATVEQWPPRGVGEQGTTTLITVLSQKSAYPRKSAHPPLLAQFPVVYSNERQPLSLR